MKQIYIPYTLWEDFHAGMWRVIPKIDEPVALKLAIEFTGDDYEYGFAMLLVIEQWPNACKHNLTNPGLNRRAWVGHAACCLSHGLPEYIVRSAWGLLTIEQRILANKAADFAILIWEQVNNITINYAKEILTF